MPVKLKYKDILFRKEAEEMIVMFARHGNHPFNINFKTKKEIIRYFTNKGVDFQKLVEDCRNPKNLVPNFENALGSTWKTSSDGDGKIGLVDKVTEEEVVSIKGDGELITSKYMSLIEDASEARDRSVAKGSLSEFLTAASKGVSSIEAYLRHRVSIHNKMTANKTITQFTIKKMSIDQMMDELVPIMSGKKFIKSDICWHHFKKLQQYRHNEEVHPKCSAYAIQFGELATRLNLLRTGISGLLINLHLIFNERIPREVIRMRFAPDVIVSEL